jgi:HNH endonuclease
MTTPAKRVNIPNALKEYIYERDDNVCQYCSVRVYPCNGDKLPWREIDHILPVNHGGTNEAENLALACGRCNGKFKDRLFPDFESKKTWIQGEFAKSANNLSAFRLHDAQVKRIKAIRLAVYDLDTLMLIYGDEYGTKLHHAIHNFGWSVDDATKSIERLISMRQEWNATKVFSKREQAERIVTLLDAGYTYEEALDDLGIKEVAA